MTCVFQLLPEHGLQTARRSNYYFKGLEALHCQYEFTQSH